MKRFLFLCLALLPAAGSLSLSAKDIDIRARGAKADGKTKVTAILQKAIDDVSASGGGRVIVQGGTFLITPVELKSGVDLHIEAGATLLASPDLKDYPERTDPRHYLSEGMPRYRNASVIFADEAENIAITGRGTIDCNGTHFVKPKEGDSWTGWHFVRTVPRRESLPRAVFFAGCRNVTVSDITMTNQPAGWSYWIHDCEFVVFDRCKILADLRYPNNDGIHINCSRNVAVSNCFIETGDDSIVIRANSRSLRENKACEFITVTNCTLRSWSAGIRFGWTQDGVIRNCTFSNLVLYDTTTGFSFYLPRVSEETNDYGREATLMENLSFSNIQMDRVLMPVYCHIKDKDVLCAGIRKLSFTDLYARSLDFPFLMGREDCPIEDVSFNNCRFEKLPESEFPDATRHGANTRRHFQQENNFTHVKGIRFNNTQFDFQ